MLDSYIKDLSDEFIYESQQSPRLLIDMAAMEKYMAENYSNRVFTELLQNADDAGAIRIYFCLCGNDLVVANDGRPFDKNDIQAICRSGASKKQRGESIGYRGIGFKSTTILSSEIYICSADTIFTFSRSYTAEQLEIPSESVPIVRIPFLVEKARLSEEVTLIKNRLEVLGYTTIFVFRNAEKGSCLREISALSSDIGIFLRNICEIISDESLRTIHFKMKRSIMRNICMTRVEDTGTGTVEEWYVIERHGVAIAIPADSSDYKLQHRFVFYSYLPTMDYTGFDFKVNGDFSTDPSRKHIVSDAGTHETIKALAHMLAELIIHGNEELDHSLYSSLIEAFVVQFSPNATSAALDAEVKNILRSLSWISTMNGNDNSIANVFCVPDIITNESIEDMARFDNISLIKNITISPIADRRVWNGFIRKLGGNCIELSHVMRILTDIKIIHKLKDSTLLDIWTFVIKEVYLMKRDQINKVSLSGLIVKIEDQYVEFGMLSDDLALPFKKQLSSKCSTQEIDKFFSIFELEITSSCELPLPLKIAPKKKGSAFSKWRAAEEKCVEIERLLGNTATDVSRKNLGYDVMSNTPDGHVRYIEVKSVQNSGDPISLTNNEYTTAHQYGIDYHLCVLCESDGMIDVIYVSNIFENGRLEKRVKMWEWLYDNYEGTKYSFAF